MGGKIHLKNGKIIQEKAAEEAVKDFIIYTQQRAKDLLEIIEPDDFIGFTDLVFESPALTTLFFFIFPISRTEPRFFSEIDNKETALALHELNLHFLAKGKSPNFFYGCFVEMFTVVGMTAKIKESGVPGDFDTIMNEVTAHYCQERTLYEDEDANRLYVLTQWKALKVDAAFCCGTAEHNKRDAEMHFFGLGSEHRQDWENLAHAIMIDRLAPKYILPSLYDDTLTLIYHKDRVPEKINPSDLPKLCGEEGIAIPLEWAHKYQNLLKKTYNCLVKRLKRLRYLQETAMRNRTESHYPLYQSLVDNPHEAASIVLEEFMGVVHRVVEKVFSGDYEVGDIPGTVVAGLKNACINQVERELGLKKHEPLTIAISLEEENKEQRPKEIPDSIHLVAEPKRIEFPIDPVRQLIADNLNLKSPAVRKKLQDQGQYLSERRIQQIKREIVSAYEKAIFELELEFRKDIGKVVKKLYTLRKDKWPNWSIYEGLEGQVKKNEKN